MLLKGADTIYFKYKLWMEIKSVGEMISLRYSNLKYELYELFFLVYTLLR